MNPIVKRLLPHLAALGIFFLTTVIYFSPMVFEGKVINQYDINQAKASKSEILKVLEESGDFPLWTNSMFGGMPTFQILFQTNTPIRPIFKGVLLGNNMSASWPIVFLLMSTFYLLLVIMKIDWRIAIIGGLCFGLATNHIILVEAGHLTKLTASAYMAPILAGMLLAFRKQYIIGGGLVALSVGLQIYANHVQITYYFFLLLLIFGAVYLVDAIIKKEVPQFFKTVGILAIAVLIGVGSNASRLWTTYEYSQESIRGTSELKDKGTSSGSSNEEGGGLSKNYGFYWSYGVGETFNLMVPAYRGGGSYQLLLNDEDSATRRFWSRSQEIRQLDPSSQNMIARSLTAKYWGDQPGTSGPVYMGALLIFLFLVSAFLVKSPLKWWVVIGVVLTIMMAWGKNFAGFNYFIFDNLPLYNKFRAMTMILGITNFMMALLAFKGLQEFFTKDVPVEQKRKSLIYGGATALGLLALAALGAMGADYGTSGFAELGLPDSIARPLAIALEEDRSGLLWGDWTRSLILVAIGAGILWFSLQGRLKPVPSVLLLGALLLFDTVSVDLRQLNSENYQSKREQQQLSAAQPVDEEIMNDKELHFRVLDMRGQDPFQNALTSFHHKSLGGYHAAKLMRFQEVLERYLRQGYTQSTDHIYNMFNMKYLITQNGQKQVNTNALGNAWFVQNYKVVPDGDTEIAELGNIAPRQTALIQSSYAEQLNGWQPSFDSLATIKLTSYHPDEMVYTYSASKDQLAVFSEIYYPSSKGWKLYLNDEPMSDILKVNFLFRGAKLPAGTNQKLVMKFEPKSYKLGEIIAIISGLLAILLTIGGAYLYFRSQSLESPNRLEDPTPAKKKATTKAKSGSSKKQKKK